jgi:hypothetical protein
MNVVTTKQATQNLEQLTNHITFNQKQEKTNMNYSGTWRITEMELWSADLQIL